MRPNTCLHCRKPFRGRSDKKFCSSLCRSAFNNAHQADRQTSISQINRFLRKNRDLLKALYLRDPVPLTQKVLEDKGFQFEYHTHQRTTKGNNVQLFCYDYGIEKKGRLFKVIEDKDLNAPLLKVLL